MPTTSNLANMAAYGEHAAEVAADYRQALEDLTVNTRYEISNLTLIARENTESAMAISDVLLDHIKKVGWDGKGINN